MGDQDHGQVPVQVSSQCSWSYLKYAKYFNSIVQYSTVVLYSTTVVVQYST